MAVDQVSLVGLWLSRLNMAVVHHTCALRLNTRYLPKVFGSAKKPENDPSGVDNSIISFLYLSNL
jgi:hypothetical protein